MNDFTLVAPFEPGLIDRFRNQTFVIRTDKLEDIVDIHHHVRDHNGLLCIHARVDKVLSLISFDEKWKGVPVLLSCRGLGNFRSFLEVKPALSALNFKVFFPGAEEDNFTAVKILSSLGIHSGILLDPEVDWELASDLLVYAVYNKAQHAPVEPFHYTLDHYDPMSLLHLGHVVFDDPYKFIHIDKDENLALSERKLEEGDFIGKGPKDLEQMAQNKSYLDAVRSWQELFLKEDGCAYCKAWRVCMGKFLDESENRACVGFFSELMDVADENRKIKQNGQ